MRIEINTVATVGKAMRVARERQPDDTEALIVHLKITDAVIDRDVIDELMGQPIGWSNGCLFDDLGAPIAAAVIGLPNLELDCAGVLRFGNDKADVLSLGKATLKGIQIALADKSGLLCGELTWFAAGDETADAESLLGKDAGFHVVLSDGGQGDMLRAA